MNEESVQELSFRDYTDIVRRRWRAAAVGFVAVLAAAGAVAVLLPPVFRSTATILIEQQEIPQELVRSTITSFADQRIQLIKQRVMTTSNLLEIIRRNGLYADIFDSEPREVIIDRMRKDIRTDMISADVVDPRSGRPVEATIAFTVGYDNRSPELAVRVANELTSLYLQENSQTRREQAAEASNFLGGETKRLSDEVANLEARLADFKQANVDRLPELAQLNLQLLNRTESDIGDLDRERNSLEERRIYLEAQLAQLSPTRDVAAPDGSVMLAPAERLRALESYLASVRGIYTADHPDVVRTEKTIAALRTQLGAPPSETDNIARELEGLRAQRAALLDRYQPLHPDVVRVDRQIEAAEARHKDAQAAAPATPAAVQERADNPVYVQLQAQLDTVQSEQRSLVAKEAELRKRLADLERRLRETPGIERDYYGLTRDLESARRKYQEVNASQREAVVAQNLEMDDKAERFTLIEPPLLPQRPVAPNRWVIVLLGVLLALAAAVGTIAGREAFDGSVHGAKELQALLRAAPLGIIPLITTPDDRRARNRQRTRFAVATVGACLAAAVLLHVFVAPVDALWFAALRRFGV